MTGLLLFSLDRDDALAQRLCGATQAELGRFERRFFPDGETYFRYRADVRDRDVALCCALDRPDTKIMPLLIAASAARTQGARRVGLIAPYLAYMRQDRAFHPGEAVTSETFARLLSANFDWLVTVDPHLHRRKSLAEIYSIPAVAASAAGPIARWLRAHVASPVVIGPDSESAQWVEQVASLAGARSVVLAKSRKGESEVDIAGSMPSLAPAETPVIIDDIIASAGTMSTAIRLVRTSTARPPLCIGVHAVFAAGADERLRQAGAERIVTTDTIQHPSNAITVGDEVGGALASLQR